jgi:hypothetical protein
MKRFVEGVDRGQSTLFPECLEDWITKTAGIRIRSTSRRKEPPNSAEWPRVAPLKGRDTSMLPPRRFHTA